MTSNEGTSDTTGSGDVLEQHEEPPSTQVPEQEPSTPEEATQTSTNGNGTPPSPDEVLGQSDKTSSSQTPKQEPSTPVVATQGSSNGNIGPGGITQNNTPPKNTLPQVYSDQAGSLPEPPPASGSYPAAVVFLASMVSVPFAAMVFTTAIYILPPHTFFDSLAGAISWLPQSGLDIISGFAITILLWLVFSIPFRSATTRDNAQQYSIHHIYSHLLSLKTIFRSIQEAQKMYNELSDEDRGKILTAGTIIALRNDCTSYYDANVKKVQECLTALNQGLQQGGLGWLDGSGYLNAWNLIHRAEEALVNVAPVEEVVKEALHDDAAIDGSAIPTRDDTLNMLRLAVRKLNPTAGIYMKPPAVDPSALGAGGNNPPDPPDSKTAMEARNAIRIVKLTLDEFRDGLWDGLVRIRNRLVLTAVFTGILSYLLLCAVLLLGATIPEIQAALIFYLVGAFTGMFGRLIIETQTDSAVDDYGLTIARVVLTPLIAGLAGLAGVFLLAILSVNLLQSPTATGPTKIPTLDEIYSIARNPQGLLSAAIFGLTPNLFITVLQQQADAVKTKLKNSSASNQGNN